MGSRSTRRFLDFLACSAFLVLLTFAALVGYYMAACSDESAAIGRAVLFLLLAPFAFPVPAIASISAGGLIAFAGAVWLQPAKSIHRFGVSCLFSVVASLIIVAASARIAEAVGAHARCSFGF